MLVPTGEAQVAELDIGALVYENDTRKSWEMLTGSSLRSGSRGAVAGTVVFASTLRNLDPGEYHLTSFVRNKLLDLYGGGATRISVPARDERSLLGPFIFFADRPHMPPM